MQKYLQGLSEASRRLGIPSGVTIELLAPCNLRCPHCYVSHDTRNKLTRQALVDLFDHLRDLGTFNLTFTGGEIGLRKDLFELIAEARARRFAVYLLSSGTLWGPKEWDQLAELGVSGVRVSLYGVEACTHDAATAVEGSYDRTIATVEGLMERGVYVALSSPIMAVNAHAAGDLIEFGEARGLSTMMDANIHSMDSGDPAPKKTLASFEQLVALFRDPRVQSLLRSHNYDPCARPDGDGRPCGVGEVSAFIRCTGDVYPCATWPHSAGTIFDQPFSEIWFHSPVFHQARAINNRSLSTCHDCGDRAACSPCAAMNVQDTGSVAEPSPTVCTTTAARAIALWGESRQQTSPARRAGTPRLPIVA